MKRLFSYSLILFLLVSITAGKDKEKGNVEYINDTCKRDESMQKCKGDLSPFRYNSAKTTKIVTKPYDQIVEVAVQMYYDTEYRFVFNLDGIEQEIKVEIYDKAERDPSRKLLYESSAKHFQFEPEVSDNFGRVFINYIVPPTASEEGDSDGDVKRGCVVLATGFRNV